MNATELLKILQHPQNITHQQTGDLESVIKEFPYFQSARAIYLKGLKKGNSFKYNQELKTTAAYTTDRSILFDFITSEVFIQNKISESIKQNIEHLKNMDVVIDDVSVDKHVEIDTTLKQQIKDTDGVLDSKLFQPKEKRPKKTDLPINNDEAAKISTQESSVSTILNLGEPFQFNKNEKYSFNEWLKLTRFKPIVRKAKNQDPKTKEHNSLNTEKSKKFKLIDEFILKKPKINPFKSSTTKENLAKAQMIQPESLMTETLARIYVEQKNYKKAIQSYKILSLKYPEKSGFFANQIKAVEQLQEQNNKE